MAGQTSLNGSSAPPDSVLGGVGAFGANLTNLAQLQVRLALLDLKEGNARAGASYVALALALVLLPGGLLLLLAGIALWIAEATTLSAGQALVAVAVGAMILAALAGALALRGLRSSYTTFRRSSEELQRNLAWVKTVLSHSGRS